MIFAVDVPKKPAHYGLRSLTSCRVSCMLQRFFYLLFLTLVAQPALSGAFVQRQGMVLAIQELSFSGSLQAFDRRGRVIPVAAYRKFTLETSLEYGALDWLTLLGRIESVSLYSQGPPTTFYRGLGMSEVGARAELWRSRDEELVFSAQSLLRLPMARQGNPADAGMATVEKDFRLMAGGSFDVGDRPGFWSVEAGVRQRGGPEPDEKRIELVAGLFVVDLLQAIAQGFHVFTPRTALAPASQSHKAQVSLLFNPGRSWSVQAGVFRVLAGVNVRRESGALIAFWRRM